MTQAIRTPEAERDLRDIAFYIGVKDHRPEIADRLIDDLISKCELYAGNPGLGTARSDLGEGLRVFPFKRWVVIYQPSDDGIEVLRVVDGARDYSSLFK